MKLRHEFGELTLTLILLVLLFVAPAEAASYSVGHIWTAADTGGHRMQESGLTVSTNGDLTAPGNLQSGGSSTNSAGEVQLGVTNQVYKLTLTSDATVSQDWRILFKAGAGIWVSTVAGTTNETAGRVTTSAALLAALSDPAALVAGSQTGTHASPSTTNPLSPTWTTAMHSVWYGVTGTINLPAAAGYTDRGIMIYNTGAFTVTIDSNGSEVIVRDGTAQSGGVNFTLSSGAGNYVCLISDGTRWITLGFKGTLTLGS